MNIEKAKKITAIAQDMEEIIRFCDFKIEGFLPYSSLAHLHYHTVKDYPELKKIMKEWAESKIKEIDFL